VQGNLPSVLLEIAPNRRQFAHFQLQSWSGENLPSEASAGFCGDFLCWADWQSGFVSRLGEWNAMRKRSIGEGDLT
jgi:hypothetical protein